MSDYGISVLSFICMESFVALSTYLLLITGQVSFGQQAYFGIGAYIGGSLTALAGFDLTSAIIAGALVAGLVAAGVGALTFRLGGLYFAIATLAFAELVRLVWVNLTYQVEIDGFLVGPKGSEGFRDIRYLLDNDISSTQYLWIILGWLALVMAFFIVLERSRLGLSIRMVENDETAAASIGISPTRHKIMAAALAGAIAGIGGVLFAHYMTFIDPRNFGVMLGVHSLAYAMIGGMGTFIGPLIGVGIDIGLLESLRIFSGYRMIVFGSLVALILIFRPRGLFDEKTVHKISLVVRRFLRNGRKAPETVTDDRA
jgi:branched-chain amino acid transport system permease protein